MVDYPKKRPILLCKWIDINTIIRYKIKQKDFFFKEK